MGEGGDETSKGLAFISVVCRIVLYRLKSTHRFATVWAW